MDLQSGHLKAGNARISLIIIYSELFSMAADLNINGTKAVKMVEK